MLKIVYGPSGSGKTDALIRAIDADVSAGRSCFLLVPEQQAYISERDLPKALPKNAGLYLKIANFSSLADDVFHQYGGVTHASYDKSVRRVLMWDILRTLSPLLRQYKGHARSDTTLSSLMIETVEELRVNGIEPDQLENAAKALPQTHPLSKKLYDIALIYAAYLEKSHTLFGEDQADKLMRMSRMLDEHAFFEGARIYIDSFTSFTAQEYDILRAILRQADEVTVALACDDLHAPLSHFETVAQTAKRLRKLASDLGIPTETVKMSVDPEKKPQALNVLERDLWRFDLSRSSRQPLSNEEKACVTLLSCANIYEEAEAAAMNILSLIQSGMHYGDITVVVRDTEVYRGVLDAALERHGIPFFLSEPTNLSSKPLSRLILSALRCITKHYPTQDVITLVKTGLAGVSFSDAAMFEDYCATWHISGSRFLDPVWSMNPDGLVVERSPRAEEILLAANRVRRAVIEPLLALSAAMRASTCVKDRCRALYDYLCALNISEQLSARAEKELRALHHREAGETVRLYRFVTEALTLFCELLPDAELSTEELLAALSILFADASLASVPNVQDCVIVGSASILRVENVKASLLLGLCEGEFPRAVSDDGILTEIDKEMLEGYGITLNSRAELRSSEELLYVYRAMTKASERLILSTVQSQLDGSARTPSLAFSRVAYLLDEKPKEFDLAAVKAILATPKTEEMHVELKARGANAPSTLRLSQSKLRTFMLCPFSYYSTYELKLREQKDSRPSYADDGLFLHYVFEQFLRASLDESGHLRPVTEEEIEPLANEIVERYISEVCPLPPERMDNRLLHLFVRLRKLSILMLRDILAELRFSSFVPTRFEQGIGMPGENGLPSVTLTLDDGSKVLLSGKIDRIDMMERDGRVYIRVVDYKSGSHRFSLDQVRTGMDIQLVLYLFAVLSATPDAVPGGAQYLYTENDRGHLSIRRSGLVLNDDEVLPAFDSTPNMDFTQKLIKQTQDEIMALTDQMNDAVKEAATRILGGEAQKTPSKEACLFCPVRAHCDKAYHD